MFDLMGKYPRFEEAGDDGAAGGGGDGGSAAGGEGGAGDPGQAAAVANWRESLSEDLRNNEDLGKFTTIEGLAKSYINASQMIGRDKFVIPKTEEEWSEAYAKLGRPETPEEYSIGIPDGLPEGLNVGEIDPGFKEVLFKLGINETQAEGLNQWYWDQVSTRYTELNDSLEADLAEAENSLKADWGEKYDANLAMAQRAVVELGSEDLLTYLDESGLGNDPKLLSFFAGLGSKMLESTGLEGQGQSAGQTPEELQAEIGELMSSNAYTDKKDPGHNAAVSKMQKLYERLYAAA